MITVPCSCHAPLSFSLGFAKKMTRVVQAAKIMKKVARAETSSRIGMCPVCGLICAAAKKTTQVSRRAGKKPRPAPATKAAADFLSFSADPESSILFHKAKNGNNRIVITRTATTCQGKIDKYKDSASMTEKSFVGSNIWLSIGSSFLKNQMLTTVNPHSGHLPVFSGTATISTPSLILINLTEHSGHSTVLSKTTASQFGQYSFMKPPTPLKRPAPIYTIFATSRKWFPTVRSA